MVNLRPLVRHGGGGILRLRLSRPSMVLGTSTTTSNTSISALAPSMTTIMPVPTSTPITTSCRRNHSSWVSSTRQQQRRQPLATTNGITPMTYTHAWSQDHPQYRNLTGRHGASSQGSMVRYMSSKDDSPTNAKADDTTTTASAPNMTESPEPQAMLFQAETRQLLDIVTNSLYTDKEVFLRELVSNASDALEKLRHVQSTGVSTTTIAGSSDEDDALSLEIHITADPDNGTLTVADTGIGLTKEEMIENLGTIARSGSKAFIHQLKESADQGPVYDATRGIIGKFGVGFYSAFMVGETVEVRSRSAYEHNSHLPPAVWTSSTGAGTFQVRDLEGEEKEDQVRGTAIVIHLKPNFMEYCDKDRVEVVLKKYSNFVNFPIFLNGERVNTMDAIWTQDPKEIDNEKYTAFYRFIANAYDEPLDKLHFRADAPIDVRALFYIPSFHSEKYGMGRMEPGVSLYSRKVLIESKSPDIIPDWMRFVKGVVDSEDLPLSVSREKPQDSALIAKLRKVLTRKFITHLTQMAKKEPARYQDEFYKEFGYFLKEGICQDYEFQASLAKILYFETSKALRGDLMSFDEYIARCTPDQKDIYYLFAPTRDMALQSPYLEVFDKAGREVIFVYNAIDDFVMANLEKYEGRNLVSAEKANLELPLEDESSNESSTSLSDSEVTDFCAWFRVTLGDKVKDVKPTNRLGASPAVVTDNESGNMRRMMRMVDVTEGGREGIPLPKQQLEINMKHPIILGMNAIREKEPTLAQVLAEQVFDNCLLAAGLLDDGRSMLPRLNDILTTVVIDARKNVESVTGEESRYENMKTEVKRKETVIPIERQNPSEVDDDFDMTEEEEIDIAKFVEEAIASSNEKKAKEVDTKASAGNSEASAPLRRPRKKNDQ